MGNQGSVVAVSSTKEATTTTKTLTSQSSLPTLPLKLVEEILLRLPVKQLLQLKRVCKSWNSLIFNPNFAKKHILNRLTLNKQGGSMGDQGSVVVVSSTKEAITKTLTSQSSIPTLPFKLVEEILLRLPVKQLLQLKRVCKSWNSLISNPNFAKKHILNRLLLSREQNSGALMLH
jgi:predicted house-cleaning noncanonical NTP pyrophosphatase (MazG superfamily)